MDYSQIISPIKKELDTFDTYYNKRIKTKVALLSTIINYGSKSQGKKLRPSLVFLSTLICQDKIDERAYNGAVLAELLHNATLVHDDVVDDANQRRGIKSINAIWNNKTAVLVGDYFLAQGLLTAIDNDEFDYLKILSTTVKRMSEGELLALEKSKEVAIDSEVYFEIISNKTASLFSSCCEIGAIAANASMEQRKQLSSYGENIGIAFQLKDDLFDYSRTSSIIGKPIGNDIKEKKITLPLIYAFSQVEKKEANRIIKLIKDVQADKTSKKEINYIYDFAKENGGIDYTIAMTHKYSDMAKQDIINFPDNQGKTALMQLADFVHLRGK